MRGRDRQRARKNFPDYRLWLRFLTAGATGDPQQLLKMLLTNSGHFLGTKTKSVPCANTPSSHAFLFQKIGTSPPEPSHLCPCTAGVPIPPPWTRTVLAREAPGRAAGGERRGAGEAPSASAAAPSAGAAASAPPRVARR